MGDNKRSERIVMFATLSIMFMVFFSAFVSSVSSIDSGLLECFAVTDGEVSFSECPEELCNSEFLIYCMKTNKDLDKQFTSSEECNSFEM